MEWLRNHFLYVFVRCFGSDRAQRLIASYHFELIDPYKLIALIYSVIICEQETKDCARSESVQHNLQNRCFQL